MPIPGGPRFGGLSGRVLREDLWQLACFVHLAKDVAPADELAVDVQLWDRRPVRVVLDALPDLGILEDVDCEVVGDAGPLEDLDDRGREAALRELRRALHVQHDAVRFDLVADRILNAHRLLRRNAQLEVYRTAAPLR